MNRIEEYFNNLDKKNTILLYVSVLIIAFIAYYYYNYNNLQKKINRNQVSIHKLMKKLYSTNTMGRKLMILKKMHIALKNKNHILKEDVKYITTLLEVSPELDLKPVKFFRLFQNILKIGVDNNVLSSYNVVKDTNGSFLKYNLSINGNFNAYNFNHFKQYIKQINELKAVKNISIFNMEYNPKNEMVSFMLTITFWSIK